MTIEARRELKAGAFDPEALAILTTAYEEACASLAELATPENRLRIAHAVLAYSRSGTTDPETLARLAVRLIKGD